MTVTIRIYDPATGGYIQPAVIVANKYRLQDVAPEYEQINIMRPSVLGNPFRVGDKPGEYPRGEAVKVHEEWFRGQMRDPDSPVRSDVMQLAERVSQGVKIALVCCCKPRACHGDIMAQAIMGYAEKLKDNK